MADRAGQQFRDISRREFLNYGWIASLALFMAGMGGAVYAFALPRFLEGEFGGKATIGTVAEHLPQADDRPTAYPDLRTWIVNIGPDGAVSGWWSPGFVSPIQSVCPSGLFVRLGRFDASL